MNKNVIHEPIKKKKDHTLRTIFLVSLIIHILFLMMFLAVNFQKSLCNAIKVFQEKIQQLPRTELPASLKPRQSNFGTPVIFDSPPEPQGQPQKAAPEEHKQTQINEQAPLIDSKQSPSIQSLVPQDLLRETKITKINEADVVHQEKIEEQTPSQSTPSKTEELNKPEIFEKKEKQEQKKEVPIQEQAAKKTSTTEFIKPEIKKTTPQPKAVQKKEKLESLKKMPEQPSTSLSSSPEPLVSARDKLLEGPTTKTQPQQPLQPAQPKRNLIAMTKGFLDNLKDKGDDLLKRKGDDNKRPDFSEYKYLSYEARVSWQLQAAWKENAVSPHQRPHEGKAAIEFVIDQNGNIADLKLLQSSGNRDLDTMILENTKRAAPFPPLPEHFKTQHYKTGRMIKVFANNYGF